MTANRPTVDGDTLTTVSADQGIWAAEFVGRLHVTQGALEVLRLQIPPTWVGPFEVAPPLSVAPAQESSAGDSSTLAIRLPQAAKPGDSVNVQLRSPLTFADGQLPTAPRIRIENLGQREEYLSVPASLDGEPTVWTRTGIKPAELPENLRSSLSDPNIAASFRVTAKTTRVMLRHSSANASLARVRLTETTVRLADGGRYAVTRFVLVPDGLNQCIVKLPPNEHLVRVALDGHAALARSLEAGRWQVQLGPPNLPQTLEIVSRVADQSDQMARQVELSRPVLEQSGRPIPVDLSLWRLDRGSLGGTSQVTGGTAVTLSDFTRMRLEQLVSVSKNATRAAIESPLVDGFNWFAGWAANLQAAERDAESVQSSTPLNMEQAVRVPPPSDDPLTQTVDEGNAWIEQIAEIFAAAEMFLPTEPPTEAVLDDWPEAGAGSSHCECFISDGGQDRLLVRWVPDGMTAGQSRWAALAALMAVALASVWLVRTPPALELMERRPETMGIALGLAGWAWLRPSLAGFAVALVCAVLLGCRVYRERKSPRHDSDEQPISIPEEVANSEVSSKKVSAIVRSGPCCYAAWSPCLGGKACPERSGPRGRRLTVQ